MNYSMIQTLNLIYLKFKIVMYVLMMYVRYWDFILFGFPILII